MNLGNGNVEVLGCGSQDALDRLQQWLRKGPPLAAVTEVAAETVAYEENGGFTIK